MAQVYIIHGYGATPDSHWFPWLQTELEHIGIKCRRLTMPQTDTPVAGKWLEHLEQNIEVDEQTLIIGHSLGCIAGLTFLARNYQRPLAAIWVSGFYQVVEGLEELTPFSNLYAVSPNCADFKSYVIAALDDKIVPHTYSDNLAQHLKADYIRLPQGGHFLGEEGWTEFPLLLGLVKELLNKRE